MCFFPQLYAIGDTEDSTTRKRAFAISNYDMIIFGFVYRVDFKVQIVNNDFTVHFLVYQKKNNNKKKKKQKKKQRTKKRKKKEITKEDIINHDQ